MKETKTVFLYETTVEKNFSLPTPLGEKFLGFSFSPPSAPAHEFSLSRRFGQNCLVLFQGTFVEKLLEKGQGTPVRNVGTKKPRVLVLETQTQTQTYLFRQDCRKSKVHSL